MRDHLPQRDLLAALVGRLEIGQVVLDRSIEIDQSHFDEDHQQQRGEHDKVSEHQLGAELDVAIAGRAGDVAERRRVDR